MTKPDIYKAAERDALIFLWDIDGTASDLVEDVNDARIVFPLIENMQRFEKTGAISMPLTGRHEPLAKKIFTDYGCPVLPFNTLCDHATVFLRPMENGEIKQNLIPMSPKQKRFLTEIHQFVSRFSDDAELQIKQSGADVKFPTIEQRIAARLAFFEIEKNGAGLGFQLYEEGTTEIGFRFRNKAENFKIFAKDIFGDTLQNSTVIFAGDSFGETGADRAVADWVQSLPHGYVIKVLSDRNSNDGFDADIAESCPQSLALFLQKLCEWRERALKPRHGRHP